MQGRSSMLLLLLCATGLYGAPNARSQNQEEGGGPRALEITAPNPGDSPGPRPHRYPGATTDLSVRKAQMRFLASLVMSLSSGKVRAFLWFMILLYVPTSESA